MSEISINRSDTKIKFGVARLVQTRSQKLNIFPILLGVWLIKFETKHRTTALELVMERSG